MRRAANFRRLTEREPRYGIEPDFAEFYSDRCSVPEIVEAIDSTRGARLDTARANAETEAGRAGVRYLSEFVDAAAERGGDWRAAVWSVRFPPDEMADEMEQALSRAFAAADLD